MLTIKAFRQGIFGAILALLSVSFVVFGIFKTETNERRPLLATIAIFSRVVESSQRTSAQALYRWLPKLWGLAPPAHLNYRYRSLSEKSVRANWQFVVWMILFIGGIWSLASAYSLLNIIEKIRKEKAENRVRQKMGVAVPSANQSTLTVSIEAQVSGIGNWKSAIGIATIGAVLAQAINVLLGLAKPSSE